MYCIATSDGILLHNINMLLTSNQRRNHVVIPTQTFRPHCNRMPTWVPRKLAILVPTLFPMCMYLLIRYYTSYDKLHTNVIQITGCICFIN